MILFINTADQKEVTVALIKEGKVICKKQFEAQYRQAEKLLFEIDKLLKSPKLPAVRLKNKLKAVAGIVIVSGPGPFTALRIGVVVANTLAWALKIPVVGIKLSEFRSLDELAGLAENKLKKTKIGNIISPFYNKEPNITFKK